METRSIGPFEVSAIGLGCMSLSHAYGPPAPRDQAERVLLGALDAGYTLLRHRLGLWHGPQRDPGRARCWARIATSSRSRVQVRDHRWR